MELTADEQRVLLASLSLLALPTSANYKVRNNLVALIEEHWEATPHSKQ